MIYKFKQRDNLKGEQNKEQEDLDLKKGVNTSIVSDSAAQE